MASKGRRQRALEVVHPNCAGIDVGKAMHYVAVDASKAARPVRQSGSFTEDPDVMARWLSSCGDSGSERWTAPGGTTAVAVTGAGEFAPPPPYRCLFLDSRRGPQDDLAMSSLAPRGAPQSPAVPS